MSKLKNRYVDIYVSVVLASFFIASFHISDINFITSSKTVKNSICSNAEVLFGFRTDTVAIEKDLVIKKGEVFGSILNSFGFTQNLILAIEHEAKDIFNIRNIRAGQKYHIIKKNECDQKPVALIYEPDKTKYIVYDFRDSISVRLVEKEIITCEEFAHGKITSTLWQSLENQNINPGMIDLMEDAMSSSVDFYHTQKGDEYKLIYENKYVDGELIGMGKLIAASYKNDSGESYSILYKQGDKDGYFDGEGRPAKKAFLKSPVKFSRISSNFNLRRFHPIKGRTIPHLGTDYAAPHGTPIRSVADGVISARAYTSGNGNFVKVKHDNKYETQYLHMSRFAKGIKPGVRVRQGETIGYVGSTGLSTGPHVCFRFWKNGKQVNHLREKLPTAVPMPASQLPAYFEHRNKMIFKLNQIDASNDIIASSNGGKP